MKHCPNCGSEYQDWVKACLDCASQLEEGPAPEDFDEGDTPAVENVQPAEETHDPPKHDLLNFDDPDEADDDIDQYVDEVIESEDEPDPDPYAEDFEENPEVEEDPGAKIISVLQSQTTQAVKKGSKVLHLAGIKVYLLKKNGIFGLFYVMMVEAADFEKAQQILKETRNGNYIPIDPGVEDPELKGAPVINLDEKEAEAEKIQPEDEGEDEEEEVVLCPACNSRDIDYKTSIFSSKAKLKCRTCGYDWRM
jgi:hypothetical protein